MDQETRTARQIERQICEPYQRLARAAQKDYFGTDIRNERIDGKQTFDLYESIQPGMCRKITAGINDILQHNGKVVILDFPYPDRETCRAQVLDQNNYLRQVNGVRDQIRDFKSGTFSVRLAQPTHKNVDGALSLEVRSLFGENVEYTTSWNDEETPRRRFAILARQHRAWKLILDFRLPSENGQSTWKINPEVLY